MKLLLDTHILIWLFENNKQLAGAARELIMNEDNEIYYSALAIFEIELKHKLHPDKMPYRGEELIGYCKTFNFKPLSLNVNHSLTFKTLERKAGKPLHRDPFDNLMLEQAVAEDMTFITHDERIAEYDCDNILKV